MELFIKLKNADSLPSIEELRRIMWCDYVSISRVGNDNLLISGEEISLSWDKWIDDERWLNHSKSKEYIYFQFIQPNLFKIEIDNSATFVDKRAAFLAAKYLVEIDDGDSSFDNVKWLQKNDFVEIIIQYLQCTFESAVEESLIL